VHHQHHAMTHNYLNDLTNNQHTNIDRLVSHVPLHMLSVEERNVLYYSLRPTSSKFSSVK
jgi:hypothetical protein